MFSLALFHRTADATIFHGNNLNCFSVNSAVLNDFLHTGGTDDIGSLLHVISSRFLIMFCMFLLAVVLVLFLPRNALKCICAVLGSHVVRLSVRLSVRL